MIGVEEEGLQKIGLTYAKLLAGGLIGADEGKLARYGIDADLVINRLMKNSIKDMRKFKACGIDVKKLIWFGINPADLLALGLRALPEGYLEVNLSEDNLIGNEETLMNIGINPYIMGTKGIDWLTMWTGIRNMSDEIAFNKFGLDKERLLNGVLGMLEHLDHVGINVIELIKHGIKPYSLAFPSEQLYQMRKEELLKVGFELETLKTNGINIKSIFAEGIKLNQTHTWASMFLFPGDIIELIVHDLGLERLLVIDELLAKFDQILHYLGIFSFETTNKLDHIEPLDHDHYPHESIDPKPVSTESSLRINPVMQNIQPPLEQFKPQMPIANNWPAFNPLPPLAPMQNQFQSSNFMYNPIQGQYQQQPAQQFQPQVQPMQKAIISNMNPPPGPPGCVGGNCGPSKTSNEPIYPTSYFPNQPINGNNF